MQNLFLTIFFLFAISGVCAQDCVIVLPENADWVGKTKQPVGEEYGNNESVTITKVGDNQFSISDISGGTFRLFDTNKDISATIYIKCNSTVKEMTIETEFGPVIIKGGSWNSVTQTLEIYWSNTFNKLTDRVSIITLKH